MNGEREEEERGMRQDSVGSLNECGEVNGDGSAPSASYCGYFNMKIRPLLDQYDIIRHHLVDDPDLHPTSIVVIGDQSSGKSSVLESLIQIALPRGENIVTRMPIVLQCRSLKTPTNKASSTINNFTAANKQYEHVKISISSPNDERSFTLTDFSQIEKTILTCQETVFKTALSTGASHPSHRSSGNTSSSNSNLISDVPIYVQVVKAGIPDVTLVDLPGINYANETIKGNIKSLYEKYISPENVIILNVISAVTDIHANESVLFAHKVDPSEKRTIQVLTKLDKCSEGDVRSKLSQLKMSNTRFVLVRNRTSEEIAADVPFQQIRLLEEECLSRWTEVDSKCKGIGALSQILVNEGYRMVLQSVEQLSSQVPKLLLQLNDNLSSLGQPCDSVMEKKSRFDSISRHMASRLRQLLDGLSNYEDGDEMFLNANIQNILNNYRQMFFKTQKTIFSNQFKAQIKQSLTKTVGINLPNFLSHPVFKLMLDRLLMNSGLYKLTTEDLLLGNFTINDNSVYDSGDKNNITMADAEDSNNTMSGGLMQYISTVVEILLNEALNEKSLSDKFENKLKNDLKLMLQSLGGEVCVFLKQLIDAELIAGPYTADTSYITTIQKVEEQIKSIKDNNSKQDKQPATNELFPSNQINSSFFGKPTIPSQKPPANQTKGSSGAGSGASIVLGDDFSIDLYDIESIVNSSASVEEVAIFQMQVSLFAYWSILQKRLTDHVHLAIRSGICHELKKFEHLMDKLWKNNENYYLQILQEKSETQEKRCILQQRIYNLKKASDILTSLGATIAG